MKKLVNVMKLLLQPIPSKLETRNCMIFCCSLFISSLANAQDSQTYQVPLSSSTTGSIPSISDADMKQCVEIYNEANWLKKELDNAQVKLSLPASVDAYNSKASLYSQMADYFNINCAGKRSEPAERVTQKLNQLSSQ